MSAAQPSSHIEEALKQARFEMDKFLYSAPRDCAQALENLFGYPREWGAALAMVDISPLIAAYMDVARQLVTLPEITDPVELLRRLLDQCVEHGAAARPGIGVEGVEPVAYLAAHLRFLAGVFLDYYAGD